MSKANKKDLEAAKPGSNVPDTVAGFLYSVVGEPARDLVGFLGGDWIKYARYRNLQVLSDKVEAIRKARATSGKTIPLPPKFALPLLEAASLEDEEPLQDLWARLIASATDSDSTGSLHPRFVMAIKSLSSQEALIVRALPELSGFPIVVEERTRIRGGRAFQSYFSEGERTSDVIESAFARWCVNLRIGERQYPGLWLTNLVAIGVLERGSDSSHRLEEDPFKAIRAAQPEFHVPTDPFDEQPAIESTRNDYVRVTEFGVALLLTCGLPLTRQGHARAG